MTDKYTFYSAFYDLPRELRVDAVLDFLTEQKLEGEFLVWIEKWKSLHSGGKETS